LIQQKEIDQVFRSIIIIENEEKVRQISVKKKIKLGFCWVWLQKTKIILIETLKAIPQVFLLSHLLNLFALIRKQKQKQQNQNLNWSQVTSFTACFFMLRFPCSLAPPLGLLISQSEEKAVEFGCFCCSKKKKTLKLLFQIQMFI